MESRDGYVTLEEGTDSCIVSLSHDIDQGCQFFGYGNRDRVAMNLQGRDLQSLQTDGPLTERIVVVAFVRQKKNGDPPSQVTPRAT